MRSFGPFPLCLAVAVLAAVAPTPSLALEVFASIEPVAGLVERVGGERVEVEVLVRPWASPVTYEPTARQLTRLAASGLLFTVGVPFESSLVPRIRAGMPEVELVALGPEPERGSRASGDSHGGHDHGEHDPHVWLDPVRVRQMVAVIAETLAARDPQGSAFYRGRARDWSTRLEEFDSRLRMRLAGLRGATLLTYHPAYGHFAQRYGLEQVALEEAGREPGPKHLAEVLALARRERVAVLLVQPQHPRRSAEAVARELGLPMVEIDPLARDVETTWQRLADTLAPVARDGGGSR